MVSLGFTPWQGFSFRLETWPRTGDCSTQCVWGKGGAKLVPQDRKLSLSENVERTWEPGTAMIYDDEQYSHFIKMNVKWSRIYGRLLDLSRPVSDSAGWMSQMGNLGPNRGFNFFPMGEILGLPQESQLKNVSSSIHFISKKHIHTRRSHSPGR